MRRRFAFLLLFVLFATGRPAGAAPPDAAGLALVLATDVSGSVTADTYLLQMDGIAQAFEDRRVGEAIAAAGGVAVLLLQWSGPDEDIVSIPWTRLSDAADAGRFAMRVRHARRSSRGLTAIGPAILAAMREFDRLPQPPGRRVIDVSGDGMANFGVAPALARDAAAAAGITVNGLAVLTHEPWLEGYYRREVIGGPGAFVVTASRTASFAAAMRKKLALEIAGRPRDFAQNPTQKRFFARAAEGFNPGRDADRAYRLSGGRLSRHRAPL